MNDTSRFAYKLLGTGCVAILLVLSPGIAGATSPSSLLPVTPSTVPEVEARTIGPALPSCDSGDLVTSFGTYTLAWNRSDIPGEIQVNVTIPDDFTEQAGVLKVLQGEGHNWDSGYPQINGPKSAHPELPEQGKQFQRDEVVTFDWSNTSVSSQNIGTFVDHSPNGGASASDVDNVTTEYSFAIPSLRSGVNSLNIVKTVPVDGTVNSIFVKGVICTTTTSEPTATPTVSITIPPAEDPTQTPSPSPTPTVTPTATLVPTTTDTPTPSVTPSQTPIPTPTGLPECDDVDLWGKRVVATAQGTMKNGLPIPLERSIPTNMLGPADGVFFSLGFDSGSVTLRFDKRFKNVPGPDFFVYEETYGRATYPLETARVEVSLKGDTWTEMPTLARSRNALGITAFDMADAGLQKIRFIRITNTTLRTSLPYPDADGFDVNAIRGLQNACEL